MKFTLNNKEVELTKEEVQEIVEQSKKAEENKIEIKHRHTGYVIYSSSKLTFKEAVEEAVEREANLGGADLGAVDLMHAKFYGKGGSTKIKKSQVDDFFSALGVIVED